MYSTESTSEQHVLTQKDENKVIMYFDVDETEFGADDSSDDTESKPLSWRLAPEDSMSDWKVNVIDAQNEDITTVYHVHKNILAIGPRRSRYFSRLFRTSAPISELNNATSYITLGSTAAAAFPAMLDFIYGTNNGVFTATQAVALRYLAHYFDIRALHKVATKYIRNTLTAKTAPIYLAESAFYHDDRLMNAARDVCAQNFDRIYVGLLAGLPPDIFRLAVTSPNLKCKSEWLSKVVSKFCRSHEDALDADLIRTITSSKIMPKIMPEESPYMLKLCADYGVDANNNTPSLNDKSSLRRRCIEACCSSWSEQLAKPLESTVSSPPQESSSSKTPSPTLAKGKKLGHSTSPKSSSSSSSRRQTLHEREEIHRHYKGLPSHILIELLESAIIRARSDIEEESKQRVDAMSVIASRDREICDLLESIAIKNAEL